MDGAALASWFSMFGYSNIITSLLGFLTRIFSSGFKHDILSIMYNSFIHVNILFALILTCASFSDVYLWHKSSETKLVNLGILMEINMIVSVVLILLYMCSKLLFSLLSVKCDSGLSVMPLDLASLSKDQLMEWIRAIDQGCDRTFIGAKDGASAMDFMKLYSKQSLDSMRCIVLHVFEAEHQPDLKVATSQIIRAPTAPISDQFLASSAIPSAHYPFSGTRGLVFVSIVDGMDATNYISPFMRACCGRSSLYNWMVFRVAVLGFQFPYSSGVFLATSSLPSSHQHDLHQSRAMQILQHGSLSESSSDILPNQNGRQSSLSSKTARGDSDTSIPSNFGSKPWRDNASTLYKKSLNPRQQAEITSMLVLSSVIEWNCSLPDNLRWDVLFLPCLHADPIAATLTAESSGFSHVDFAPNAIIDLKPHKNKTWDQYLAALSNTSLISGKRMDVVKELSDLESTFLEKGAGSVHYMLNRSDMQSGLVSPWKIDKSKQNPLKDNQDEVSVLIENASGDQTNVISSSALKNSAPSTKNHTVPSSKVDDNLTTGSVGTPFESIYSGFHFDFFRMWSRMAAMRITQGDAPILCKPTPPFFTDIENLQLRHRILMLMRSQGRPIASSVVFRSVKNKTLTWDLMGIDAKDSEQYSAHKLMIARVIRLGLEQQMHYIDLGSSDLKEKISLGATLIGNRLGIYSNDAFLRVGFRIAIRLFASRITSELKRKDHIETAVYDDHDELDLEESDKGNPYNNQIESARYDSASTNAGNSLQQVAFASPESQVNSSTDYEDIETGNTDDDAVRVRSKRNVTKPAESEQLNNIASILKK
jgi:hypothetical protein